MQRFATTGRLISQRSRGGANASRNKISNNRPPSLATNGRTYNDYQIPFELSYEVDVWGRIRRTVESYRDQAQASAADLATVNLSMHAQVALFYFQARVLDAEEQLLNSTVTQYEQALGIDSEPVCRRHCFRFGSPAGNNST